MKPVPIVLPHVLLLLAILALPAAAQEGETTTPSAAPAFALPPLDQLNAIIERPLFLRGRRPLESPEPEPAEAEETPVPEAGAQMILAGIATDQAERAVAIIQDVNSGASFRAWIGDEVAGWRIETIRPRVVILVRGVEEVEVSLDEPAWPAEGAD